MRRFCLAVPHKLRSAQSVAVWLYTLGPLRIPTCVLLLEWAGTASALLMNRESKFYVYTGAKTLSFWPQTTGRRVEALVADSLRATCLPGAICRFRGGRNAVGFPSLWLSATCLTLMLLAFRFFCVSSSA